MKKVLLILLILPLILLCGFRRVQKPFVILSTGTITSSSVQRVERYFNVNQRINFALIIPEKLKYAGVRMQISKQSDKTSNWGFSIIETKDIYIVAEVLGHKDVNTTKKHYAAISDDVRKSVAGKVKLHDNM